MEVGASCCGLDFFDIPVNGCSFLQVKSLGATNRTIPKSRSSKIIQPINVPAVSPGERPEGVDKDEDGQNSPAH